MTSVTHNLKKFLRNGKAHSATDDKEMERGQTAQLKTLNPPHS